MTHAASAVTARGLALAGAAPANFLRHNPKSADSKAWFATEAPSANAAGPPRFHHLPPACLALAGATCHSHSSSLNRIVVHRVTPITTMAKPSHCVFGNSRRVALTDTLFQHERFMANAFAARKDGLHQVVSVAPSIELVPVGPVFVPTPFQLTVFLNLASTAAKSNLKDMPAFLAARSVVPVTIGDEPTTGRGVKSGTQGQDTWALQSSSTVFIEGKPMVHLDCLMWMNGAFAG
ncbi:hypothetical protein BKIR_c3_2190 [Candidatus Paraburkholderia kirkii UZHbot1]|uniref:Uncharacterized protein n=1 Tax=Candidatus Paraburkholderia kirkii UZHbot1 TaxID=1055526 RepID=G4MB82_9BURK|nr:hypothetical protein BKIR_c3_2190 [Candidatus Paraburkholderia kirkii UZHbot1]